MPGPPAGVAGSAVLSGIWPIDPDETERAIARLPPWDDSARQALHDVEGALATPRPAEAAAGLRARHGLLERAVAEVERIGSDVELVVGLEAARARLVASEQHLEDARLVVARPDELPGVGGPLWQALWASADHYSVATAYPGHAFPFIGDDLRCVLCQQPLTPEAKERLVSLAIGVSAELEHIVQGARDDLAAKEAALARLQLSVSVPLTQEIRSSDEEAATRLEAVFANAATWVGDSPETPLDATQVLAATSEAAVWLRDRAAALKARSELLGRAADPAAAFPLRAESSRLASSRVGRRQPRWTAAGRRDCTSSGRNRHGHQPM